MITRRLGQPLVIAEVLAGIVLGPSLLGWLWPEAAVALFPAQSMPVLQMLAQVGLVLFMFLVGLEFDARLLKGHARSSVIISHTSIVVPFALGAVAGWWLYEGYAEEGVSYLSFVLFLGVAMSITAFPVLARILSERHLLGSRVGAITMACAAVDDVTAWCILAFVVAVARAQGLQQALWTTLMALVFITVMLKLMRPFLERLGERVASREGLTSALVVLVLLLLFISSTVTEMIGIHALFGAFLFGAILPKSGRLAEMLIEKLETVAVLLLLPLFFAYSGLRTEIGLLNSTQDWMVALALIGVASLGKFGGSTLAARLTGMRWREASALGILMNTRGLMELIVLNIGLDLGVISPTVFTMMVIMALVTTVATTPILALVYPDRELARDRLRDGRAAEEEAPAPVTAMVCISNSDRGVALATLAGTLLARQNAHIYALHLREPSDSPSAMLRKDTDTEDGPLGPFLRRMGKQNLDVRPLSFVSSEPAADICRTARAKRASMVLLGAHKPLLLESSLDGTVSEVIEQAPGTVGVLIDHGLERIQRVLVACAGDPGDREAVRLAARLCSAPNARLSLLYIRPPRRAADAEVPAELLELAGPEAEVKAVVHPSPATAALAESRLGYDLVVIGKHDVWGLSGGRFGLRRHMLAESPASLLVIAGAPAAADAAQEAVPQPPAAQTL
ncbi:cation/H(+) antiporter [Pseudothauera nasutitermitis]|uniref:Cation/H(+) antiporter n=2 Tax=Pseudothauera nasutitermitis TaxID=2565930 RepID=A0A4S4AVM7_9RHOO|nr:cation/H(+) antiporter [Pseudothauera nasutitermitis]